MYKAKKHFGQNFLSDVSIIRQLVSELNVLSGDTVVEIGGGQGAITSEVIKHCDGFKEFHIYELDSDLKPNLDNIISRCNTSYLHIENILDSDLGCYTSNVKIIGSLPYNITSPILHKLLKLVNRPERMIFVVQKEVGEKLIRTAPKGSYWSHITLGYDVSKVVDMPRHLFKPIPNVDSMAVCFERNIEDEKILSEIGILNWEKFLHHVFKHPRKMIRKTFEEKDLVACEISPMDRPQHISRDKLIELYKRIG